VHRVPQALDVTLRAVARLPHRGRAAKAGRILPRVRGARVRVTRGVDAHGARDFAQPSLEVRGAPSRLSPEDAPSAPAPPRGRGDDALTKLRPRSQCLARQTDSLQPCFLPFTARAQAGQHPSSNYPSNPCPGPPGPRLGTARWLLFRSAGHGGRESRRSAPAPTGAVSGHCSQSRCRPRTHARAPNE
jgi:hypothetical protein